MPRVDKLAFSNELWQASAFLGTLDPHKFLVLCGDLNITLEEWDCSGLESSQAAAGILREIVDHRSLVDVWCVHHPDDDTNFTYVRVEDDWSHHSWLDRIYFSHFHLARAQTSNIQLAPFTDHHLVMAYLSSEMPGPANWHFDNSLLEDVDFVATFREFWLALRRQRRTFPSARRWWDVGKFLDPLCLMPTNKSPGMDRLTVEFYRVFWDVLGPDLVTIWAKSLKSGVLPLLCRPLVLWEPELWLVLSAYANDVLLVVQDLGDLVRVEACQAVYSAASSAQVNWVKSSGLVVGDGWQETHKHPAAKASWQLELGDRVYFSHLTVHMDGAATLFSPDLRPEVLGVAEAVPGRLLHLWVRMEGLVVNLVNVYALTLGPERLRFYHQTSAFLGSLDPHECLVLGRDFNTALEERDHLGTEQCPAAPYFLQEIVDRHALVPLPVGPH
ncbi:unnamed protein product [Caretta caretta]